MHLLKEEFARQSIHNGCPVWVENSVTQDNGITRQTLCCPCVCYPHGRIFYGSMYLTAIKDSSISLNLRFNMTDDKRIHFHKCGTSSEFVSSSIPSWQILTAHAQPFRGARDLFFCLKVPLDSLLVWASSGGSGKTASMRRLAWTFAARICDKYQIRLTRPKCKLLELQNCLKLHLHL